MVFLWVLKSATDHGSWGIREEIRYFSLAFFALQFYFQKLFFEMGRRFEKVYDGVQPLEHHSWRGILENGHYLYSFFKWSFMGIIFFWDLSFITGGSHNEIYYLLPPAKYHSSWTIKANYNFSTFFHMVAILFLRNAKKTFNWLPLLGHHRP